MNSSDVIDLTESVPEPHGSSRNRLSRWWQKIVIVRVKALVYLTTVLIVLVSSFQIQNYQINAQRIQDVADRQDQLCDTRIRTRKDLREVLFRVVDLSDVLPGERAAEAYTKNRIDFINNKYPEITVKDCD